jgi:hypothetical protein
MQPAQFSFEGTWTVVSSTLPDGQDAYTGLIEIRRERDTFSLEWDISAGNYVGMGLVSAGHLYVSCGEQRAGLGIALVHNTHGRLAAVQWSTAEMQGGAGDGELISGNAGAYEGEHALRLRLPGGSTYGEWVLKLRRTGSLFEAVWLKRDVVHFAGLALEMPSGLALGWYPDPSQLAFMDYRFAASDPDRMTAQWALGGYTSLGTETLQRE